MGVYLASLGPARTRTGTGTSPHTHETHARDHSRPAPTARPNGAARPRPWEPDARAPGPPRRQLPSRGEPETGLVMGSLYTGFCYALLHP